MEDLSEGTTDCNHQVASRSQGQSSGLSRRGAAQLLVRFQIDDDPRIIEAVGRDAWALLELHKAGPAGLTTLTQPAPRWSHYIWKLRGQGVPISTEYEAHGGEFSGKHGRYRLIALVDIVEVIEAGEAAL